MRRRAPLVTLAVAVVVASALVACGPDDGRHLAEPSPDLTAVAVPTTSPAEIIDLDPDLQTTGPGGMTLSSPDFSPGASLPESAGCQGSTSPALGWTPPPRRARELALVVQDVDGDGAIHWLVTGIPPDVASTSAGSPPIGGEVRLNSRGTATWASPCAQDGFIHRIVFTLYALDRPLAEDGEDTASIVAAVRAAAFGESTLLGRSALLAAG